MSPLVFTVGEVKTISFRVSEQLTFTKLASCDLHLAVGVYSSGSGSKSSYMSITQDQSDTDKYTISSLSTMKNSDW